MSDYQEQIQELRAEIEFLKKCAKFTSLMALYFEELNKFRTNHECFEAINNRYFDLVGEYLYSDYESFMRTVRYHRKKNRTT
nr:hypothetical protein [Allomuricauda sp.]